MESPELLNQRLNDYYRTNEANGPQKEVSGGSIAQEFGNLLSGNANASPGSLLDNTARREANSYRGAKLTSFSDLYERAVKNVLNIRPFFEDTDEKFKVQALSQSDARKEISRKDGSSKDANMISGHFPKLFENSFTTNGSKNLNDPKDKPAFMKFSIKDEGVTSTGESTFQGGVFRPRGKETNHSNGFFSHVLTEHARYFGSNASYVSPFPPHTLYSGYEPQFDHGHRPSGVFHPLYGIHARWLAPYHNTRDYPGHTWSRHPSVAEHAHSPSCPDTLQAQRHQGSLQIKSGLSPPPFDDSTVTESVAGLKMKQEFVKLKDSGTASAQRMAGSEESGKSSPSQSPTNDLSNTEKENENKKSDSDSSRSRLKDAHSRMKYRPYGLRSRTSFLNQTIELKGKTDHNRRKDNRMLDLKRKNLSPKERYLLYLGLFKVKANPSRNTSVGSNGQKQSTAKQGNKNCKDK